MSKLINNKTHIDEAGDKVFLFREKLEDIDRYQTRIEEASTLSRRKGKNSFKNSLGYLTSKETVKLFTIIPQANIATTKISYDGVFLYVGDNKFAIDNYKFLKDFKNLLIGQDFTVQDLEYVAAEHQYLKTRNVLQFDSERERLEFHTGRNTKLGLNENYVSGVYDHEGRFSESASPSSSILRNNNDAETWFVEDGNILYKEIPREDKIGYSYKEYPLTIEWSEFVYYSFNDENFDYRIKSLALIEQADSEEKPYLLTQEGAMLIDKLNRISSTYWGK